MKDLNKFRGVFCARNAIYDENDNIDENKIKELVNVYKSLGVKGVYACGSTGEGFLLSMEETARGTLVNKGKLHLKIPSRKAPGICSTSSFRAAYLQGFS